MNDEIKKYTDEVFQAESMMNSFPKYSDDWFVWNDLRKEAEARLKCSIQNKYRLLKAKGQSR